MQKIILYTDTPLVGGAEKHMQLLAKYLLRDGYEVKIVCSQFKKLDPWVAAMKEEGIEVIRLKVSHKHDPRNLLELRKIISKEKPDILHIHLWNPGACRFAFWASSQKNLKIVTTEHDPFPLKNLKKSFKKKTIRKTAVTIAVSSANSDLLLRLYPELKGKLSMIHNGIDLDAFEKNLLQFTNQEKAKIRRQLFNADAGNFIITTVAALHSRKGLNFLIDAFNEIYQTKRECKLVIVGEGPQKKDLEKQIKKLGLQDAVKMTGPQENIAKILKSSDLFVLPSVKEAFGLVVLEAMAAKLPVIASKVGGIPEIIEDGKNGMLTNPEDKTALAQKMLLLIKNAPLREKIAFLGHHRVKDFDVKKMVKKTEAVYDQVLGT